MHLDLNGDKFSLQAMTDSINAIPEVPTFISSLGIFEEDSINTLSFSVEKQSNGLAIVATSERGGPGETIGGDNRELRVFSVPHFERDDGVNADEVQGVRKFGSEDELEVVKDRIDRKMARHTRDFDFTQEHLRLGAIKGVITAKKKDGTFYTLLDCYQAWDISAPSPLSFGLSSGATDVRAKCVQILDQIDDALEGLAGNFGVVALAGDSAFHALTQHDRVKETFMNWEAAADRRGDARAPFSFGGIEWKRCHTRPGAKAANGASALVGDNEFRFIPRVPGMFKTYFSPADYNETVNTMGLPRYAKLLERRNGKGYDMEMQTNTFSMCMFPQALFSGVTN